jgi:Polyketide cyclase / dehydrase and lipid transport
VNISQTFGCTAPPDLVFGTLTDADSAVRWLPSGVRVERLDGHRLRVVTGDSVAEYDITTDVVERRVTWACVKSPDLRGTVRVQDGPIGGSRLRITVSAADAAEVPRRMHNFLDQAMRHLERDLDDLASS